MCIVVKKNGKMKKIYQIFITDTHVVQLEEMSSLVQFKSKRKAFLDGAGSVFCISGYPHPTRIGSLHSDSNAIRWDWKRVGQSLLDGTVMLK